MTQPFKTKRTYWIPQRRLLRPNSFDCVWRTRQNSRKTQKKKRSPDSKTREKNPVTSNSSPRWREIDTPSRFFFVFEWKSNETVGFLEPSISGQPRATFHPSPWKMPEKKQQQRLHPRGWMRPNLHLENLCISLIYNFSLLALVSRFF